MTAMIIITLPGFVAFLMNFTDGIIMIPTIRTCISTPVHPTIGG